jgi:hypothetical protein
VSEKTSIETLFLEHAMQTKYLSKTIRELRHNRIPLGKFYDEGKVDPVDAVPQQSAYDDLLTPAREQGIFKFGTENDVYAIVGGRNGMCRDLREQRNRKFEAIPGQTLGVRLIKGSKCNHRGDTVSLIAICSWADEFRTVYPVAKFDTVENFVQDNLIHLGELKFGARTMTFPQLADLAGQAFNLHK